MALTSFVQLHAPHTMDDVNALGEEIASDGSGATVERARVGDIVLLHVHRHPDELMLTAFDSAMQACLKGGIDLRVRVCTQGTLGAQLEGGTRVRQNIVFAGLEEVERIIERVPVRDLLTSLARDYDAHMTREAYGKGISSGLDCPESVFVDCSPVATRIDGLRMEHWALGRLLAKLATLASVPAVTVVDDPELSKALKELGHATIGANEAIRRMV